MRTAEEQVQALLAENPQFVNTPEYQAYLMELERRRQIEEQRKRQEQAQQIAAIQNSIEMGSKGYDYLNSNPQTAQPLPNNPQVQDAFNANPQTGTYMGPGDGPVEPDFYNDPLVDETFADTDDYLGTDYHNGVFTGYGTPGVDGAMGTGAWQGTSGVGPVADGGAYGEALEAEQAGGTDYGQYVAYANLAKDIWDIHNSDMTGRERSRQAARASGLMVADLYTGGLASLAYGALMQSESARKFQKKLEKMDPAMSIATALGQAFLGDITKNREMRRLSQGVEEGDVTEEFFNAMAVPRHGTSGISPEFDHQLALEQGYSPEEAARKKEYAELIKAKKFDEAELLLQGEDLWGYGDVANFAGDITGKDYVPGATRFEGDETLTEQQRYDISQAIADRNRATGGAILKGDTGTYAVKQDDEILNEEIRRISAGERYDPSRIGYDQDRRELPGLNYVGTNYGIKERRDTWKEAVGYDDWEKDENGNPVPPEGWQAPLTITRPVEEGQPAPAQPAPAGLTSEERAEMAKNQGFATANQAGMRKNPNQFGGSTRSAQQMGKRAADMIPKLYDAENKGGLMHDAIHGGHEIGSPEWIAKNDPDGKGIVYGAHTMDLRYHPDGTTGSGHASGWRRRPDGSWEAVSISNPHSNFEEIVTLEEANRRHQQMMEETGGRFELRPYDEVSRGRFEELADQFLKGPDAGAAAGQPAGPVTAMPRGGSAPPMIPKAQPGGPAVATQAPAPQVADRYGAAVAQAVEAAGGAGGTGGAGYIPDPNRPGHFIKRR